jgi:hypothetical protein
VILMASSPDQLQSMKHNAFAARAG